MLRAGVFEASFRNRRSWRTPPYRLWQLRAVADKVGLGIDLAVGGHRWRCWFDRLGRDFAPL